MKKIILFLLLISSSIFSKETIIYDSDTIVYYCVDDYVEAEFKDIINDDENRIPVLWFDPKKNKETELKCIDFVKWSKG